MAKYDWEIIESEYRLGQKSLRQLSLEYGPNHTVISRRAKKYGWVQDKSEEVRQRANAILAREEGNTKDTKGTTPTPEEIEAAAKARVRVVREHRTIIAKGHNMVSLLFSQLDDAANNRDDLEDDIIEATKPDEDSAPAEVRSLSAKRNKMLKAIALPAHAAITRDLSTALKNLIPLERQAFALDKEEPREPNDIDDFTPTERNALKAAAKTIAKGMKRG